MPLRCLLFSSNEEMVQPIWQVLADLGIEGEYCQNAVDAVEKVTTQPFQIVITDWDDQPEAGFLLKTARELKAAQRPLTLAIVSEDARLPEALQAGANSVLVKPIRAEQVRDTMSTACELLRAKQQPGDAAASAVPTEAPEPTALAAAASAGAVSTPASRDPVAGEKPFARENFCSRNVQRPARNSIRNVKFRSRWIKPRARKLTHSRNWSLWPPRCRMPQPTAASEADRWLPGTTDWAGHRCKPA